MSALSGTSVIYMANQIAVFFESQGDHAQAVAGVADHIHTFWNPAMIRELLALVDAHDDAELRPVAREAVEALR